MTNQLKHVSRIYSNIRILLQNGQFSGNLAPTVVEADQFLELLIHRTEASINEQEKTREQNGDSNRDAQDVGGISDGGVQDSKRPSRKRKSK